MIAALFLALAVHTPSPPSWTARVRNYRLLKWSDMARKERETIVVRDGKGRAVTTLTDFHVGQLGDFYGEKPLKVWDLDRDGAPEIVLESTTGGAHGSSRYFVWSLGKRPKCMLAYDKNNVSDEHDFDLVDLDGDGRLEIRTWYDGFSILGGSNWQSLPVVLRCEAGRYVDRTPDYKALLGRTADEEWNSLAHEADVDADPTGRSGPSSTVVSLICLADATHTSPSVWKRLKATLPKRAYDWASQRKSAILQVYRGRTCRYQYPAPYRTGAVRFNRGAVDRIAVRL